MEISRGLSVAGSGFGFWGHQQLRRCWHGQVYHATDVGPTFFASGLSCDISKVWSIRDNALNGPSKPQCFVGLVGLGRSGTMQFHQNAIVHALQTSSASGIVSISFA
jgi:hypothetical protein